MSLLAGVFSRVPGRAPDPGACAALLGALSRDPRDRPEVHRDARCLLAKVDTGAFGAPGVARGPAGEVTLLAGEPLLDDGAAGRASDLARLHAALLAGDAHPALRRARGVFAAAQYDPARGVLRLVSDRLGVRPLHCWIGDEWVVFASQLRVLEAVPLVPRTLDVRAVSEMAAIGIALGRRTAYAGVERIGAGEVVEVDARAVRRSAYGRWDELEPTGLTGEALARAVDARFRDAVAARLGGDRTVRAFLSGGMDSRAVTAVLRDRGAAVHTFNFSLPGMQDTALAEAFAREAGTLHRHFLLRWDVPGAKYADTLAKAWEASPLRRTHPPERPALAWSGDGGSVGMGHVYLSPEIARRMRAGDVEGAADAFLAAQGAGLPRRVLAPGAASALLSVPREGVVAEVAALRPADPARAFHLFLMLNDQRRHLAGHFEELDRHRVELQLPFFDGDLLALVLASPVDEFVGHALYTRWFGLLPPAVRAVPWQTYPGHVPCPLPIPDGLGWQWDRRAFRGLRRLRRRRLLAEAGAMLASRAFPSPFVRRGAVALAAAAYAAGVRDYSYVLRAALEFHRAWTACGGRWAPLEPLSSADASAGASADTADAPDEARRTADALAAAAAS